MPIKGILPVDFSYLTIRRMLPGDCGYILIEDITFTKEFLLLHLDIVVVDKSELSETGEDNTDPTQWYALIRKIGTGVTEDDFELDFTHLQNEVFTIESHIFVESLLRKPEAIDYIFFKNPPYDYGTQQKDTGSLEPLDEDDLQEELDKALEARDFEKARLIEAEREKRKTPKHPK